MVDIPGKLSKLSVGHLSEIWNLATEICMKTTLNFDDRLIRAAKARAAEEGETLTRLLERALRDYLAAPGRNSRSFHVTLLTKAGRPVAGVNLDDRDMLYERMDGRD